MVKEEKTVYMWGYLPAVSQQRAPLLCPTPVPPSTTQEPWIDVCPGGCGFALALSESGKLNTWGSTDDLGQSYLTSGKHEEVPEPFPLQTDSAIVNAAAGWAHCVAVTDRGEVYTWGWKECVPVSKTSTDQSAAGSTGLEKDTLNSQAELRKDQGDRTFTRPPLTSQYDSPDSAASTSSDFSLKSKSGPTSSGARGKPTSSGTLQNDITGGSLTSKPHSSRPAAKSATSTSLQPYDQTNDDGSKRRRIASAKQGSLPESSSANEEAVSAPPCLVSLRPGVKVAMVAAGGRHTLALSDTGQVWGWGYGGEGQLGLGSRIRTVSSPHPVPCFGMPLHWKDLPSAGPGSKGSRGPDGQSVNVPGSYIKAIACGGRHSAVITDAGALLTFGWGLYGQCGQGCTEDELSPAYVSSLAGLHVEGVAAGLWHTVCITATGDVYSFGGNQFGQLGTGGDQAEILPRLLEAPCLETEHAKMVSCGARHSAICTESGKVLCWGWNKYGQLGLGDAIDRNIPCEVPFENNFVTSVSCGWWHTLASANSQ